jgi:hypothetical protein
MPALPWLLFFLIGGGAAVALWLNRVPFSEVRSEAPEPAVDAEPGMIDPTPASTRVDMPKPQRR